MPPTHPSDRVGDWRRHGRGATVEAHVGAQAPDDPFPRLADETLGGERSAEEIRSRAAEEQVSVHLVVPAAGADQEPGTGAGVAGGARRPRAERRSDTPVVQVEEEPTAGDLE